MISKFTTEVPTTTGVKCVHGNKEAVTDGPRKCKGRYLEIHGKTAYIKFFHVLFGFVFGNPSLHSQSVPVLSALGLGSLVT